MSVHMCTNMCVRFTIVNTRGNMGTGDTHTSGADTELRGIRV